MNSTTSYQPCEAVLLLGLFLSGDTQTQRVEVTCSGHSVDEPKSQVLNLNLPNSKLRFFPPSCMASRR